MSDPLLNILIAYPYFTGDMIALMRQHAGRWRLIVDSGAFTAWNTGKHITLDGYCRFLDRIEHLRPFHAVQLDVFGDPEATYKNFLTMKRRGYDVMPVFTRGDTLGRLEEFYSATDYIMFGGIVFGGKNKNYVKWFLDNNKGRKCHWLGFTNMEFIKAYRPESVDASSWQAAGRYGNLELYDHSGNFLRIKRTDFAKPLGPHVARVAAANGLTPAELAMLRAKVSWVGHSRQRPTFKAPVRGLAYFTGTIGHVLRAIDIERNLGTKMYLSVPGAVQLQMIFDAYDFLRERGVICAQS